MSRAGWHKANAMYHTEPGMCVGITIETDCVDGDPLLVLYDSRNNGSECDTHITLRPEQAIEFIVEGMRMYAKDNDDA